MGNAIYRKEATTSLPESITTNTIYDSTMTSGSIFYQNNIISYNERLYYVWIVRQSSYNDSIFLASTNTVGTDERIYEIPFSFGAAKIKIVCTIESDVVYYAWTETDYYTGHRFVVTGHSNLSGTDFSYTRQSSTDIFSYDGWEINNIEFYENYLYVSLNGDINGTGYYQNFMGKYNTDNTGFSLNSIGSTGFHKHYLFFTIREDIIYYIWSEYNLLGGNQIYTGSSDMSFSMLASSEKTSEASEKINCKIQYYSGKIYYLWEGWRSGDATSDIYAGVFDISTSSFFYAQVATAMTDFFANGINPDFFVFDDKIYYSWLAKAIGETIEYSYLELGTSSLNVDNFISQIYLAKYNSKIIVKITKSLSYFHCLWFQTEFSVPDKIIMIYFSMTGGSQNIRVRNLRHKTSVSSEVRARGVYWKSITLTGYQQWTGYPDSPVSGDDHKYQTILSQYGDIYLVTASIPLVISIYIDEGMEMYGGLWAQPTSLWSAYHYVGGEWNYNNNGSYEDLSPGTSYEGLLFSGGIETFNLESNFDIYSYPDGSAPMRFGKTTTLAQDGVSETLFRINT